jgi:hypothetical protein
MALWKKVDTDAGIPKYLNEEQKANAVFIDNTEAKNPNSIKKGITGPGWWLYNEYKDSFGNTRHKAEYLVSMKTPATDSGDRQTIDAGIELPSSYVLSFTTKPTNRTVIAPAATTLVAIANISAGGGALSYQWEKLNTSTKNYEILTNTGVYSGVTTNTLDISNTTGFNGATYRVIVSAANAVSITSVAVKLIVS